MGLIEKRKIIQNLIKLKAYVIKWIVKFHRSLHVFADTICFIRNNYSVYLNIVYSASFGQTNPHF